MGRGSYDWNAALDTPPKVGTPRHLQLTKRARSWVTCAVGNQCASIPRDSDGGPLDPDIFEAGQAFSEHIRYAEWEDAKETLAKIEFIAARLIKDMS